MGPRRAGNSSLALRGVCASLRQVGTRPKTQHAASLSTHSLRARHLRRTILQDFGFATGIDRQTRTPCVLQMWNWFDSSIVCSGAQRGHGSTLWRQSFTIWCDLGSFPVGIWSQLDQDDARCGHLKVRLDFTPSPDSNEEMYSFIYLWGTTLNVCHMQFLNTEI